MPLRTQKKYVLEVDFGRRTHELSDAIDKAGIQTDPFAPTWPYYKLIIKSCTAKTRLSRRKKLEALMLAHGYIPALIPFKEYEMKETVGWRP